MPAAVPWLLGAAALAMQLQQAPASNADRLAKLREFFVAAGCAADLAEQAVPRSALPNLSCLLPGAANDRVVVGAHYDKVRAGRGVIDNWSGAVLLPALYSTLAGAPRELTFQFVAFSDEERGELGSRAFVGGLDAAGRERIVAMINLDALGTGTTRYEPREADPELVALLRRAAEARGMRVAARDNGRDDHSDHEPFNAAGIPAIRLHALDSKSARRLHTGADRFRAIDARAYEASFTLIATYLGIIDRCLGHDDDCAPP